MHIDTTDQSKEAHLFLDKHIHARANSLISELLEKGQKDWDLIDSPWYEDLFCQYEENSNTCESDPHGDIEDYCPEEPDPQIRDPYEFWIVSDYFASKLKAQDQLLTDHWGFWIWGRETTNQSILLDYVFQKIWQSTIK
jgi:hypothetical protein